ncbi:hypothetical protein Btru_014540 [Bulinus truncatus]|nr:hypothetical protein Btru_014540 [Bulinus truncatus]
MGHNPVNVKSAGLILSSLVANDNSGIKLLDLSDVSITTESLDDVKTLETRGVKVMHGCIHQKETDFYAEPRSTKQENVPGDGGELVTESQNTDSGDVVRPDDAMKENTESQNVSDTLLQKGSDTESQSMPRNVSDTVTQSVTLVDGEEETNGEGLQTPVPDISTNSESGVNVSDRQESMSQVRDTPTQGQDGDSQRHEANIEMKVEVQEVGNIDKTEEVNEEETLDQTLNDSVVSESENPTDTGNIGEENISDDGQIDDTTDDHTSES